MWICTNFGFFSIVKDTKNKDHLLIRARRKEDLEELLKYVNADIVVTPDNDYHYRVSLHKYSVSDIISLRIDDIDYTNFKNSVNDPDLHHMYEMWWRNHYGLQHNYEKEKK